MPQELGSQDFVSIQLFLLLQVVLSEDFPTPSPSRGYSRMDDDDGSLWSLVHIVALGGMVRLVELKRCRMFEGRMRVLRY
jgi:hypothetical protein